MAIEIYLLHSATYHFLPEEKHIHWVYMVSNQSRVYNGTYNDVFQDYNPANLSIDSLGP